VALEQIGAVIVSEMGNPADWPGHNGQTDGRTASRTAGPRVGARPSVKDVVDISTRR